MFKQVLPLTSIMFIRFFGMFIVLPVLSVYALEMKDANEFLVGLTFGAYAFAQMIFVIPFGRLSDKIGRKQTLAIGLLIFAAGSLICAMSSDIYMLLFGRILQGVGAISAVTAALVSDIVKEEQRTKAMAIVGMGIGMSTILSMILGPVIAAMYDLSTLFYITFVLVIIELGILFMYVPNPPKVHYTYHRQTSMSELFKHHSIMMMSFVNFFQKALIIATFVIAPVLFTSKYAWEKGELINIYLPAFVISFFAMGLASMMADAKGKYKQVLYVALVLFGLSYALLGFFLSETVAVIAVILFFVGFNMLEPMMQSLIAKYAKAHERGKVLGLFNGFGFLGSALGGVIGGFAIIEGNLPTAAILILLVTVILLVLGVRMHNPARLKNLYLDETTISESALNKLESEQQIVEWYRNDNEKLAIIKYDEHIIDVDALEKAAKG